MVGGAGRGNCPGRPARSGFPAPKAIAGCRAVVHAAAWTGGPELSPEAGYRVNVEGTRNVLGAARVPGVERFIYISSVAVYGVNGAPFVDESMPTPPVGQAYSDSKIAAEKLVRGSGLPYVIIRPASTYGPRGTAWTVGPDRADQARHAGVARSRRGMGDARLHRQRGGWVDVDFGAARGARRDVQSVR